MKRGDKLYIVTRRDLSPGYQAVQSIHAAQQFAVLFPSINREWQERSNFLGLLSVANEVELTKLATKAEKCGLAVAVWCEPDIDWKITAIAIEAGNRARKLLKKYPLALSEF